MSLHSSVSLHSNISLHSSVSLHSDVSLHTSVSLHSHVILSIALTRPRLAFWTDPIPEGPLLNCLDGPDT